LISTCQRQPIACAIASNALTKCCLQRRSVADHFEHCKIPI
jgi:hypothetical protein